MEPLITDDHLEVEEAIEAAAPELVLGTQMERHISKRLGIFCAVISAPVHVQDFPARYSPFMGPEGANVLFDTLVHPLVMGLEEHLLGMFQEDFEFGNGATPSHLAGHATSAPTAAAAVAERSGPSPADGGATVSGPAATAPSPDVEVSAPHRSAAATDGGPIWTADAEAELKRIPFFVRKKARRNTEAWAEEQELTTITVDVLYDAKAHFGRSRG